MQTINSYFAPNHPSSTMFTALFVLLIMQSENATKTYDRQFLLQIGNVLEPLGTQVTTCPVAHNFCIMSLPSTLLYSLHTETAIKEGNLRRNQSMVLEKLECLSTYNIGCSGLYVTRCSLDLGYAHHLPLVQVSAQLSEPLAPVRLHIRSGCVHLSNIHPLEFVRQSRQQIVSSSLKMALVNARSVSNKTFRLNDFFLDYLLLTETWVGDGEFSIFGKLCL